MTYAEVAVDVPSRYDQTFTYSIPESLHHLAPGHHVRVPFGARVLQGVVFALSDTPQVSYTRDVAGTVAPDPVLTQRDLDLASWVAQRYVAPLFEAAALMLPPGSRQRPRTYLSIAPAGMGIDGGALPEPQRRVLEYVRQRQPVLQQRLLQALGFRGRGPLAQLVAEGVVVRTVGRDRPPPGHRVVERLRLAADAASADDGGLAVAVGKSPRREALLAGLRAGGPLPLAQARRLFGAAAVTWSLDQGLAEVESVVVERDPLAAMALPQVAAPTLTETQSRAVAEIVACLEDPTASPRAFLLHGVTGSGKTEVYLGATQRCVELGRRAIVLVPEIALAHQTVERFAGRFPGRVAVLHSGLTPGERFDQWWKVRAGSHDVVVGSRSAVFAPIPDLGLIVLDEEHEWAYKQTDASPRYHARDVAARRAELSGAALVLGSASPDVGSYHDARRGAYRLLTLPERVVAVKGSAAVVPRAMPQVQVVDMRRELREGNSGVFSRALASALAETLESGGQAILFLNRRGSAAYLQCRECGHGLRCNRCDVALTYHKGIERFLCHYCGYRRRRPERCPSCLGYRLGLYGVGTEAVEAEVAGLFPDAGVLRWDRDATTHPREYRQLLERFRAGEAQVLVGTQMVAKGLHFPGVAVVGAVSADVGLHVPDYRAGERTFQLLCQVAGRAGRGEAQGRVVVQTYQPQNYAVQAAASQDYAAFYRQEVAFRRDQGNPPFARLVRMLYAHSSRTFSERHALDFTESLRRERDAWGYSNIDVLGPVPAYPPRVKGRYRWQAVLRGRDPRALLDKVKVPSGWEIDVDPVGLA